ncbi:response regulator transcription factor [Inquilinus sp. CA228]|uniref:response regulator transcription factor n=1 Tax=Inquilinus sp. CA228 TaxID=3455609 RepID=UPI003F8D707F
MADDHEIHRLIGEAYDAALGASSWSGVLRSLSGLIGGSASAVLHRSLTPATPDAAVRLGVDPAFVDSYNAYYNAISPVKSGARPASHGPVFVDSMIIPESTLLKTEFYNDFVRPQGNHSGLYWVDGDRSGITAHLSFWRPWRHPWEDQEIRLLQHVGQHLGRALDLGRRLSGGGTPAPDTEPLSNRERDCLACVARGASSKQTARQLGLSMNTVNFYMASARRKLRVKSRSQAVVVALRLGLLDR